MNTTITHPTIRSLALPLKHNSKKQGLTPFLPPTDADFSGATPIDVGKVREQYDKNKTDAAEKQRQEELKKQKK